MTVVICGAKGWDAFFKTKNLVSSDCADILIEG